MEVEILKPRNDKREYRRLVLDNSLQVLIISDPQTDKVLKSVVWLSYLCDLYSVSFVWSKIGFFLFEIELNCEIRWVWVEFDWGGVEFD